jgi:sigma-B regulation protein RsbU (phosphoserine phosphatase)
MLLEDGAVADGLGEGLRQLRGEAGQLLALVNEVLAPGPGRGDPLERLADRAGAPVARLVTAARGLAAADGAAPGIAADLARIAGAAERLAGLVRDGVAAPVAAEAPDDLPGPAGAAVPVAAGPATILVVDDDAGNRDMLGRRLAREGHRVRTAAGGREALAALAGAPADLVLLDVMMPGLDGYGVLAALKADPRLRHVPVIMISAVDHLASVVRCIELGAEDYLPKPFDATLLRARVGASLEKKRLRDEVLRHLDRIERELAAAREIQLSMVPAAFPALAHPLDLHATLQPAREVGGDLYDVFLRDPRTLCLVVADVSDKGAPAALFMARAKTLIRMVATLLPAAAGEPPGPDAIIARVNEELCRDNPQGMFVSLFFGMLDPGSRVLRFVSAGHAPPYRLRPGQAPVALAGGRGKPVGVRESATYAAATVGLASGEGLFLFTDGITEALDPAGDLFGEPRLEAALHALSAAPARAVVEGVLDAVRAFAAGAPQADDIAALALRLAP